MGAAYTRTFDAHAHVDHLDPEVLDDAIARTRAVGVDGWALASSDPERWDHLEAIARRIGGVAQLGLHPWWAQTRDAAAQDRVLDALSARLTPHGLGETGLDWRRAKDEQARARQLRAFRLQVELAAARDVPLVLHGVRAWGRVLDALPTGARGVLHGFTGAEEIARAAVRRGLHVSFGHRLDHSPRIVAALRAVPASQLLFETDGPDGAPLAALPEIVARAAALRGEDPAELAAVTSDNARQLFRVEDRHGTPEDRDRP